MSKQKERIHRKRQQRTRSRWLIAAGFILVLVVALWIAFSNRQSNNNGVRSISRLTTDDFHSLAFSPTEPETVFFGHHHGLSVSHNGGKDWRSTALTNVDAMALALPLSDTATMYAAGHDVFFKSTDGGKTWKEPNQPPNGYRSCVEFLSKKDVLTCGLNGVDYSFDRGKNWKPISNEGFHVCRIAKIGSAVYLAGGGGKIGKLQWK